MGQTAEAGLADPSPSGKGPVTGTPAETRPAVLAGLCAHLVEPRQGCDTVHQPVAAQVDEPCVLASVQKVNLQRYQLGEPVAAQGLAHAGVLRGKGGGRPRSRLCDVSPMTPPAAEQIYSSCNTKPQGSQLPWHNSLLRPASESGPSAAAASVAAHP